MSLVHISLPCRGIHVWVWIHHSKCFKEDKHIPNLFAFHPSIRFTEDPLYLSGKIILQDKASCFPAHILSPPSHDGALVIDATAAPGNKTSHLCAIMQNKGKVHVGSTRLTRRTKVLPPK